jgi:hypothetical protein
MEDGLLPVKRICSPAFNFRKSKSGYAILHAVVIILYGVVIRRSYAFVCYHEQGKRSIEGSGFYHASINPDTCGREFPKNIRGLLSMGCRGESYGTL